MIEKLMKAVKRGRNIINKADNFLWMKFSEESNFNRNEEN